MNEIQRALQSIGKTNFVEYFTDYKELTSSKKKLTKDDKMPLAKKLLENNPNATALSGQMIRISCAIKIFGNGWENDVLREVINSTSSRITKEIKEKARTLLTD
ncbi:hypothetical protein [Sporosarcina sp. E16_8]|uniref:hypothetical protein n=1 Tax=Sporosarcina sp. E16_8 TaxID=2789295 RepID=UPI001A914A64|nr:hypothetical protein [Sporosarcina sp. E16_8]MBO0587182.1 hypothetical protein [Sporosarcina sp. E16_8]